MHKAAMPEDRSNATVLAKPSYILGNDGGGCKTETHSEVNAKEKEDPREVTSFQSLRRWVKNSRILETTKPTRKGFQVG